MAQTPRQILWRKWNAQDMPGSGKGTSIVFQVPRQFSSLNPIRRPKHLVLCLHGASFVSHQVVQAGVNAHWVALLQHLKDLTHCALADFVHVLLAEFLQFREAPGRIDSRHDDVRPVFGEPLLRDERCRAGNKWRLHNRTSVSEHPQEIKCLPHGGLPVTRHCGKELIQSRPAFVHGLEQRFLAQGCAPTQWDYKGIWEMVPLRSQLVCCRDGLVLRVSPKANLKLPPQAT